DDAAPRAPGARRGGRAAARHRAGALPVAPGPHRRPLRARRLQRPHRALHRRPHGGAHRPARGGGQPRRRQRHHRHGGGETIGAGRLHAAARHHHDHVGEPGAGAEPALRSDEGFHGRRLLRVQRRLPAGAAGRAVARRAGVGGRRQGAAGRAVLRPLQRLVPRAGRGVQHHGRHPHPRRALPRHRRRLFRPAGGPAARDLRGHRRWRRLGARQPAARPGHHPRTPLGPLAGPAGDERDLPGIRHERLPRHGRAGRHAARGVRAPERPLQRGDDDGAGQGQDDRDGLQPGAARPGAHRRVGGGGAGEMGPLRPLGGDRAGV
ncbi:MAG: BUG/TctC family periplasmic protein, partial [uncultured Acetobacteraceae bacterium]